MSQNNSTPLPLKGIRVLDLTRVVSGPFCSMILGDLGAEIIKIESPGIGDPVRKQGEIKNGLSWYFASFNRNKKSVSLNLRSSEGRNIFSKLIAYCDVIVDNFRPGVLDDMGFSDKTLKSLNSKIIRGSITGFGTTGPYQDRPAFDFIAQAITGFMSLNGSSNGPPQRVGPPISDLVAGLYAALGVVSAIAHRERTGRCISTTVSLTGALTSMLGFHAANFLATDKLPSRTGNAHGIVAPYGIFRTKDSEIAIAPGNDEIYSRLLTALDANTLSERPEFKTNKLRLQNRDLICAEVESRTKKQTTAYWVKVLNDAGVPCGPVNNLRESLIDDPQNADQNAIIKVEHEGHGAVSMLGPPLQFDNSPLRVSLPAPKLGEHTEEILQRIGMNKNDIDRLKSMGAI